MKALLRLLLLSLLAPFAASATYPDKPIRLVVGFPQGGGVDLVARQFAGHLALELGQPVNVENVLGEAGNKASAEVARAQPDGYTLMIVNPANIAINPALYPNLGFDPRQDFVPVARLVVTPLLALIPATLSPQNMDEFITRLRTQKSLKYASGGIGNINHLAVELFKIKANLKLTHVPAKNSAAALTELLEGRVQFMTDGGHVAGKHVREGRIRVLAAFSEKRLASMPDVPTAAEVGLPGLVVSSWLGIVAPAATPDPVVARVQEAVRRALAKPEIAAELTNQGTEPAFLPTDGFRSFINSEQQRWSEVVKTSGVTMD
jgi:tripartite-type tricarboxylate transporter receptor subunit TctC